MAANALYICSNQNSFFQLGIATVSNFKFEPWFDDGWTVRLWKEYRMACSA